MPGPDMISLPPQFPQNRAPRSREERGLRGKEGGEMRRGEVSSVWGRGGKLGGQWEDKSWESGPLGPHRTSQGQSPHPCSDSPGPWEGCRSLSSGRAARRVGGSRGPQQNSNFPFISAASPAILKGRCSAVSSQANWIWASTHSRARQGVGGPRRP